MLRAVKVRHYITLMGTMGHPALSVLKGSHIELDKLAEPSYAIETDQYKKVVANMIRLTGNQGIGFEVGSHMRMTDLGIFAYAMMSARTLKGAFELWARYSSTYGMLLRLDLAEESEDHWTLTLKETSPLGFLYNFCVEEFLSITLNFSLALLDEPASVRSLNLAYPAPSHEAEYRALFRCPVEFNAEQTRITFNGPSLHQPLRTSDDELNEVCQTRCQQISHRIDKDQQTSSRLRELLLRKSSPLGSLNESAALLGTTPRSLRRQLELEGASYREIVSDLRVDLAKEYLASGNFQPKEIGYLLGFKNPEAFRRAFKSWTGQTLSDYRVAADRQASGDNHAI